MTTERPEPSACDECAREVTHLVAGVLELRTKSGCVERRHPARWVFHVAGGGAGQRSSEVIDEVLAACPETCSPLADLSESFQTRDIAPPNRVRELAC